MQNITDYHPGLPYSSFIYDHIIRLQTWCTGICGINYWDQRVQPACQWKPNFMTIVLWWNRGSVPCYQIITRWMWRMVGQAWVSCMEYICVAQAVKYSFQSPSSIIVPAGVIRAWTLYTRHKTCLKIEIKCTLIILSDTSKLRVTHVEGVLIHPTHPVCMVAAQVRPTVMHVTRKVWRWNIRLRSEVT